MKIDKHSEASTRAPENRQTNKHPCPIILISSCGTIHLKVRQTKNVESRATATGHIKTFSSKNLFSLITPKLFQATTLFNGL